MKWRFYALRTTCDGRNKKIKEHYKLAISDQLKKERYIDIINELNFRPHVLSKNMVLNADQEYIEERQGYMRWLQKNGLEEFDGSDSAFKYLQDRIEVAEKNYEILRKAGVYRQETDQMQMWFNHEHYTDVKKILRILLMGDRFECIATIRNDTFDHYHCLADCHFVLDDLTYVPKHKYAFSNLFNEAVKDISKAQLNGLTKIKTGDKNVQIQAWLDEDSLKYYASQKYTGFVTGRMREHSHKGHVNTEDAKEYREIIVSMFLYELQGMSDYLEQKMDVNESLTTLSWMRRHLDGMYPMVGESTNIKAYKNLDSEKTYDFLDERKVNVYCDARDLLENRAKMQVLFQNGLPIKAHSAVIKPYENLIFHKGTLSDEQDEHKKLKEHLELANENSIVFLDEPYRCIPHLSMKERDERGQYIIQSFFEKGATIYANLRPELHRGLKL